MRNGDLFWDHQNAVYQRRSQYSRNSERRTAEVGGLCWLHSGSRGILPSKLASRFHAVSMAS